MPVTIVKETGAGLANANSFADMNDMLTRITNTGRDKDANYLASTNDAKSAALILATEYMDDTYRDRWQGYLPDATIDTQALTWPRDGLYLGSGALRDPTIIPGEIADACVEFAFSMLSAGTTSLQPDPANDPSGRQVKRALVRVEGAVTKETEFDGGGGPGSPVKRRYPAAERLLRRWLCPALQTVMRA